MHSPYNLSYIDYLSGMILVLFGMFFLSFLQINEQAKGNIIDKSEFLIEMEWEDESKNDIDLWVENPVSQVVWYSAQDNGLMTLDRDQTGGNQNVVSLETGQNIVDKKRREVVNIRSFIPGEYTVNAVYFATGDLKPAKVKIKVVKLNPYSEVYEGTKMLDVRGETTFVTFTVNDKGFVTITDTLSEKSLVDKYKLKGFISGG